MLLLFRCYFFAIEVSGTVGFFLDCWKRPRLIHRVQSRDEGAPCTVPASTAGWLGKSSCQPITGSQLFSRDSTSPNSEWVSPYVIFFIPELTTTLALTFHLVGLKKGLVHESRFTISFITFFCPVPLFADINPRDQSMRSIPRTKISTCNSSWLKVFPF